MKYETFQEYLADNKESVVESIKDALSNIDSEALIITKHFFEKYVTFNDMNVEKNVNSICFFIFGFVDTATYPTILEVLNEIVEE